METRGVRDSSGFWGFVGIRDSSRLNKKNTKSKKQNYWYLKEQYVFLFSFLLFLESSWKSSITRSYR